MKKLMLSMAVAMIATFSFANVSNQPGVTTLAAVHTAQDKVEVKQEELPEAVKATLAAAPYNEWKVEKAYMVPGENETQNYEISLSKGEETSTAKFDKDGKVIE